MVKVVRVSVKVSGDCNTSLYNSEHEKIVDHVGDAFVLPGLCGDGYINATIDNESGRIVGWKPITPEQLSRMKRIVEDS